MRTRDKCKTWLVLGSAKKKDWVNPFLPYDEDLWVRHLSATHTLLLNKFNVVAHHLICVTRAFERQTEPLNAADLGATWQAMRVGSLCPASCGRLPFDACSGCIP